MSPLRTTSSLAIRSLTAPAEVSNPPHWMNGVNAPVSHVALLPLHYGRANLLPLENCRTTYRGGYRRGQGQAVDGGLARRLFDGTTIGAILRRGWCCGLKMRKHRIVVQQHFRYDGC